MSAAKTSLGCACVALLAAVMVPSLSAQSPLASPWPSCSPRAAQVLLRSRSCCSSATRCNAATRARVRSSSIPAPGAPAEGDPDRISSSRRHQPARLARDGQHGEHHPANGAGDHVRRHRPRPSDDRFQPLGRARQPSSRRRLHNQRDATGRRLFGSDCRPRQLSRRRLRRRRRLSTEAEPGGLRDPHAD